MRKQGLDFGEEFQNEDWAHLLALTHVLVDLRSADNPQLVLGAWEVLATSLAAVEISRGKYTAGGLNQLELNLFRATTMTRVVLGQLLERA
jgi:hypothetical protein